MNAAIAKAYPVLAATLLLAAPLDTVGAAENIEPYVNGSKLFLEMEDANRQAEAWAMCAAAYDVMAEQLSNSLPQRAQQLKELSLGAQVAVTMAVFSKDLSPDISSERFTALWTMAKMAGTELPKTRRTVLAADAEHSNEYGADGSAAFVKRLSATVEICIGNLEAQQFYIDSWRELAKSSLLQLPKE